MQDSCTVSQTVRYLSRRWTLLVILELYKGEGYTRRFSELRDALPGITPKVLSERKKELEEEPLISRKVDANAFRVRTASTLTESGLEIIGIIRAIKQWALKWKIENIACGNQDCKVCVI